VIVSILKNTNLFGKMVSRAYAAKAEVQLVHADSIAKWSNGAVCGRNCRERLEHDQAATRPV
jgi:hypothetical protein